MESRPERVRVTAPADAAPRLVSGARAGSPEDFYVRSLIRSQLRLAMSVAVGFIVVLVLLAVLITFWPQIHNMRLATIPLPWLLLGVGVYPLIWVGAALYNRASERNEQRYRDLAGR
ncbi:hypothetical protein [Zhihengliuella salsuginis]|uniref:Solute:sodium symporter small subunit n=1 Tax=Zhihengliuella salsuginis TaxID=578222 RepID=A0ABQ3GJR4_9MICC|nr:hypothetical protein [Zhihengliuella salsuginis]GHD07703.1 hypothetical protein GCM10008096_18770 [Zhihengliuella salsuginis]